jgi:hypothetical protein
MARQSADVFPLFFPPLQVIHVIGGVIVPEIKEMAELSSASVEVDAVAAGEVAARRADNVMP